MRSQQHHLRHLVVATLSIGLVSLAGAFGMLRPPPGGGGNGNGGGGSNQDLSVCITLSESGGLTADGAAPYCDSDPKIDAAVGRRRSIALGLTAHNNQPRRLLLTLGSRVADIAGDPDPNSDGGVLQQPSPGDWSTHPLPVLPAEGINGQLAAHYRVNVLHMGEPGQEPNPNFRNGRLRWDDTENRQWTLFWGPLVQAGGFQRTNPAAPAVMITRLDDGGGNLVNEWDVITLEDMALARDGAATAFLWRESSPNGPLDYCGAFDISFTYTAVEEP